MTDQPVYEYKFIVSYHQSGADMLKKVLPELGYEIVNIISGETDFDIYDPLREKQGQSNNIRGLFMFSLRRDVRKAKYSVLGITDEFFECHFLVHRYIRIGDKCYPEIDD